MGDVDPELEAPAAPRKPIDFEEAEVIGPIAVATVEESDEAIEDLHCDCGNGEMEAAAVRRTRTTRRPRRHFERHYFRCSSCGTQKILFLDVTQRREVLGV
jgi:uncharacterized protein CbrC (UPF0167 family)